MVKVRVVAETQFTGAFYDLVKDNPNYQALNETDKSLLIGGFAANICYTERDMEDIMAKPYKEQDKIVDAVVKGIERARSIMNTRHLSPIEHKEYVLYITGIPKLLAMIINNEKQYTTSEKSARYTKMQPAPSERKVYEEWLGTFKDEILDRKPDMAEAAAEKLGQENARYGISVATPTKMIYKVNLRQVQYLIGALEAELDNPNPLYALMRPHMVELVSELRSQCGDIPELQDNDKGVPLSLIKDDNFAPNSFGKTYNVVYNGTPAQVAQAHRHRTLDYDISLLPENTPKTQLVYVPKIIRDKPGLVEKWTSDLGELIDSGCFPQGMMVQVSESGSFMDFVRKTKERNCKYAQLEIYDQTIATGRAYQQGLQEEVNSSKTTKVKEYYNGLLTDLNSRMQGARCTQPDYTCKNPCGDKGAVTFDRII